MPPSMKIFIVSLCVLIVVHESRQFLQLNANKDNDKKKNPGNEDRVQKEKEKNKNNNFFLNSNNKKSENENREQKEKDQNNNNLLFNLGQRPNQTENKNEEVNKGKETEQGEQITPAPGRKRKSKKRKDKHKKSSSDADAETATNVPLELPVVEGPACEKKSEALLEKIRELRALLENKLPEKSDLNNYIKDDNYLFRWLIASELDVKKCETNIFAHIKWRNDHKIDEIENEDFGLIEESYHVDHDGQDKYGRPVVEWWLHDWDIGAAITTKGIGLPKLARWVVRLLEITTKDAYELNVAKKFCVTQAIMLVDAHDLDEKKHGCSQCWQIYAIWAQYYETHYPNLFYNVHFTNANNTVFVQALKVMAGAIKQKQRTLQPFKTYKDEKTGQDIIDEQINPDQRSSKFGGTKGAAKEE